MANLLVIFHKYKLRYKVLVFMLFFKLFLDKKNNTNLFFYDIITLVYKLTLFWIRDRGTYICFQEKN